MSHIIRSLLVLTFASVALALAQPATPPGDPTLQTDADWIDARWAKTDVGQFLCWTIETPREKTPHGIAIKVGEHDQGAVCFDPELLRYSAGWTGGFLELHSQRYGLMAGRKPEGTVHFTSMAEPGWANSGSFEDPRERAMGPLPRDWGRFRGFYLNGTRLVLSYTVGDAQVLESPWLESRNGLSVFTRTLQISNASGPLRAHLCDVPKARMKVFEQGGVPMVLLTSDEGTLAVALRGNGAALETTNSSVRLRIEAAATFPVQVFLCRVNDSDPEALARFVKESPDAPDLTALTKGGPARWTQPLTTRGAPGFGAGPLVIDALTVPYENPWNALFFTSGHDFFPNGDLAVATAHGDVWRVSGVDARLQKLSWKRFATGLYEPLGLKIVEGVVHVLCRDQIMRLHDVNGDGEADFYENFTNEILGNGGGHSYTTCLETDAAGNFYVLKCGENSPHGGTLLRVTRDGSRVDVIATGFRNPNGLGIGPGDIITAADQQGEWVPETRLDVIQPRGFYGYMPMHKRRTRPTTYDPPLCWITRTVDNSAGGQVWVPPNQWGALGGHMLHLSYGRCTMMVVLRDDVNPHQGAVVPLPGRFLSGVMRGRFSPHDGHLYLTGLRGWQTAAIRDGCLQRVRYTGQPVQLPVQFAAHTNGIRLTFSEPLDRATAETADSFAVKQWNFVWSAQYGSPDHSVRHPDKKGRDELQVRGARLSGDGRALFVEIADLRPAMQTELRYNVRSASGKPLRGDVYLTLHELAPARE